MTIDIWTLLPSVPKATARAAQAAEAEGWDGVLLPDSQNLGAELVVEMAMCAARTERVLIAPGVTNCVTRHPAVLASAMATLQAESGGRMVLGIGRGDSALAHIGLAPAPIATFRRYLEAVQGYLRGDAVVPDLEFAPAGARPVAELNLGKEPEGSRLQWLRPRQPRVPIDIAATGPKMIALAATKGDAVALSVGSDPERVRWAIGIARTAREEAGLDPDGVRFAAHLNIAVHPDLAVAQSLVSGGLASFSRFSVMDGTVTSEVGSGDAKLLADLHRGYDMVDHGRSTASHTAVLTEDFAMRNGVIGSPEQCLERLETLRDLGITRFMLMESFSREGDSGAAHTNLVREVLPVLRSWK